MITEDFGTNGNLNLSPFKGQMQEIGHFTIYEVSARNTVD
jgi:hypothetical protein